MEFKNLLLLLTDDGDEEIITPCIQFCKFFRCKLFVLFVIEPFRVSRLASLTHQQTDKLLKVIEEQGWKLLYLVEDEATENDIRTSLHYEEGNMIKLIKEFVENYDIDAIFVRKKEEAKKLFVSSPVMVIGL